MFARKHNDVLVVGGGPVGLFAALRLAESGLKVQVVDQRHRTGAHSYALALHPRSLRLLDESGLTDSLSEQGHRVDRVVFFEDGRQCGELALGEFDPSHPFTLVLPQSALEGALEQALRRRKVKVLWNHRLEDLRAEGDSMVARIARLDQISSGYPIARLDWVVASTFETHAAFVIGADGYHSRLRRSLDIEFEQLGRPRIFSAYEVEPSEPPRGEVRVLFDGKLDGVLWPISDDRCRWSFEIEHADQHDGGIDGLNALLRARAPWYPPVTGRNYWSSVVQFDRRLAASLGRDRVWLAGDAAHLTGPIGVQSMNAGLVDAHELAAHLARAVRSGGPRDLDRLYGMERTRELCKLFCDGERLVFTEQAPDWARRHAWRVLSSIPATGRHLDALLAQLGIECRIPVRT